MDPPINNKAVLTGVLPITVNVKVGNLEPFAHSSETLGTMIYGNSVLRSVLLLLLQMTPEKSLIYIILCRPIIFSIPYTNQGSGRLG